MIRRFESATGMGARFPQAGVELTGSAGGFPPALSSCRSRPSHPVRFFRGEIRVLFLFNILYTQKCETVDWFFSIIRMNTRLGEWTMMSKKLEDKRMQMEMVWIEKLVPEDHLVRKLDHSMVFDFI